MEAVNAQHSAVRVSFLAQNARPAARTSRTRSRYKADSAYRRLDAAFHRHADDVPEDSFPTFLEALLLEDVVELETTE